MEIIIVGAGIIGLTSAWRLTEAGYKVTIIEQNDGPSLGASFANGGMLSVGHSAPHAKPGVISMALKNLISPTPYLAIRPTFSFAQTGWLWRTFREANESAFKRNQKRMVALSALSSSEFPKMEEAINHALKKHHLPPLNFSKQTHGILQICQNGAQLEAAKAQQKMLEQFQIPSKLLTKEELFLHEPALKRSQKPIIGALHLTQEASGDSLLFAQSLASLLPRLGVTIHYNTAVTEVLVEDHSVRALVIGDDETISADRYLFTTGARSSALLRRHLKVPIYPVKGYSLTFPIIEPDAAPRYSLFDTSQNIAITRFDNTIRVAGYAGIEGFNSRLKPKQIETIKRTFLQWFPDAVDPNEANPWAGFRPMTPDGTPIIGATPLNNLYINSGHGTFGWTMSAGSATLITDIISNKPTSLPSEAYALARY